MTDTTLMIIAVVVVIALLAVVWVYIASRRRQQLRSRFGPEFERTAHDLGSEKRAEAVLAEREKRVASYRIRELSSEERARFAESWRRVQGMFVDDPASAVTEGDMLVTDLMNTRGYPMSDFEQRAEDLTVGHAEVVHHYRAARDIATRHSRKAASTEDLRQALVHYRELFGELLGTSHQARRSA
jgi:hypothetical protein